MSERMTLDQIAARLEELSVELESEELQGLANAVTTVEDNPEQCKTCATRPMTEDRHRLALDQVIRTLMHIPESREMLEHAVRGFEMRNNYRAQMHYSGTYATAVTIDPKAFLSGVSGV